MLPSFGTCCLNLLLLLTALFASLTGTGSGERSVQVAQGVAVVRAAEAANVAAQPARHAAQAFASRVAVLPEHMPWALADAAPMGSLHFPFERRLE